jgi:hypothetical protein
MEWISSAPNSERETESHWGSHRETITKLGSHGSATPEKAVASQRGWAQTAPCCGAPRCSLGGRRCTAALLAGQLADRGVPAAARIDGSGPGSLLRPETHERTLSMSANLSMLNYVVDARVGIRNVLVAALVVAWSFSAGAQADEPPPEGSDLICIEADPPIVVLDSARVAAQLVGFETPKGLSIQQSQRLSSVAQAFVAGREELALQHWAAAVNDAVKTVGARNLDPQDIMDLTLTVLKQAVAENSDGLRLLIAQIDHLNAQKSELRDYLNQLRDQQADLLLRCPESCDVVIQEEVDAELGSLNDRLDSLGDMTNEKQARLQMYMEPFSQTAAMVSNVLAKTSDTAQRMLENLK